MLLYDKLIINSEREYTDEGFLKVPARISRCGVQDYTAKDLDVADKNPDDIIKVYRPEDEVFSDDSLRSFEYKTVTNNHPPELINAANSKKYMVGMSGHEVIKDGIYIKTMLHVSDKDAIQSIENGKVELSNGYTTDIEWTPGVTQNGEQYDAIQRNIKGNHIAIVERGRAGHECRVADNLHLGDNLMSKITIDGVDFEASDQVAQAVGKLRARVSDMEKEAKEKDEELEAKEKDMKEKDEEYKKAEDSLKAKLDSAEAKTPTAETLDKMVADRAAVIDAVTKVCPTIKWEGKDADLLRKEVVMAKCANVAIDTVSKDYINARFDTLVDSVSSHDALGVALTKQLNTNDKQDNRPASVIAREKMMADSQNAWKKGNK